MCACWHVFISLLACYVVRFGSIGLRNVCIRMLIRLFLKGNSSISLIKIMQNVRHLVWAQLVLAFRTYLRRSVNVLILDVGGIQEIFNSEHFLINTCWGKSFIDGKENCTECYSEIQNTHYPCYSIIKNLSLLYFEQMFMRIQFYNFTLQFYSIK